MSNENTFLERCIYILVNENVREILEEWPHIEMHVKLKCRFVFFHLYYDEALVFDASFVFTCDLLAM